MSPRRSSRAPSTKAEEQPESKAASNAKSNTATKKRPAKRAASPDSSRAPAPKRSRTSSTAKKADATKATAKPRGRPPKKAVTPARKSRTPAPAADVAVESEAEDGGEDKADEGKKKQVKKATTPKPRGRKPKAPVEPKPFFNQLPQVPQHERPPLILWGWGAGNFGQLGMGPDLLDEYPKPKRNQWMESKIEEGLFGENGAGIETIVAGGMHTIFVDEKGTAWTCGVNDEGALGRETKDVPKADNPNEFVDLDELTSTPFPVEALVAENFRAVKIAAGDNIGAAVSSEGELRVWGSFRDNQGSLGFSSEAKHQTKPTAILELKHKPHEVEKFVGVASGNNHLLVLTTAGHIYTLGAGEEGQLGRKVISRRKIHGTAPEKIVLGKASNKAVYVGAGNQASFAVDEDGDVWGWGLNSMGQTGTGYNSQADTEVRVPKLIKNLTKAELGGDTVVEISGGDHHTLFLTEQGEVYACGRSNDGQLGLAEDDPAFENRKFETFLPDPVHVTFPDANDPIAHVSAGTQGSMAVTRGGALYAWGVQTQGELGIGASDSSQTPRVVVRKEGGSWSAQAVSCGGQHSVGLFKSKTAPAKAVNGSGAGPSGGSS